jgi:hypothetical protein
MGNSRQQMTDDELSMLLRAVDHAPPDLRADEIMTRARRRHTRRSTLIAAAALVAATTVAAAAVPGFALHEYIRHAIGAIGPRAPQTAHVAAPAQVPTSTASVSRGISFVPARRTRVVFAAEQSSGSLRVRVTDELSLRITQTSSDREAQFTLTPDGASVHNSGSTASYEILIPDSISDAVIVVAGRSVYSRVGMHSSCAGSRDSEQGCVIAMHGQKGGSSSPSPDTAARRR